MRGATKQTVNAEIEQFISIHAPRERSDIMGAVNMIKWDLFQSTLLVRGATDRLTPKKIYIYDFNPRSS